jgi:hypothetical protein
VAAADVAAAAVTAAGVAASPSAQTKAMIDRRIPVIAVVLTRQVG